MTELTAREPRSRRHHTTAFVLAVLVAGMVGLAFAAVPLYQMFCQATGYGGTTRVSSGNPKGTIARDMTVRFDANVDHGLPWKVTPAKPISGQIGEVETINFVAVNTSDQTLTGSAIFNVTPELAGGYFNKIECFCFTEQTLKPGERVEMPVSFFVDPDLAQDDDLDTLREITLSYTFYASDKKGT